MKVRLTTVRYRLLAGSIVLMWPLLGFAAPPPGADPDGDGPGAMGFDGPSGPMRCPGCGHFAGGEHGWGLQPRFLMGLKLTEDQEDKVFAILHAAAPALREQAKALRKAHDGLRDLPTAAQYDDARAKALADTAGKAISQLALLRTRAAHEIYALLTADQRAEMADRRRMWESHHHESPPHH
jgi:periplasmic protein CpxP/Spy